MVREFGDDGGIPGGGDGGAPVPPAPTRFEDAKQFLTALYSGARGYVCFWSKDDRRSACFTAQELVNAAHLVASSGEIYVGIALSDRALGPFERVSNEDVAGTVGLIADIDVEGKSDPKRRFPSIDRALGFVMNLDVAPSLITSTGGGLHCIWAYQDPWLFADAMDRGRAADLSRRFHTYLRAEARAHGVALDNVSDLARVFRTVGSLNLKYGAPRYCHLIQANEVRYTPDQLAGLLPAVPTHSDERSRTAPIGLLIAPSAEPPADKFATLLAHPRFRQTWEMQRTDLADTSPSAYDMSLANFAARAGWEDQEIADLLIAFRRSVAGTGSSSKALRADYLQRTIAHARERVHGGDPAASFVVRNEAPEPVTLPTPARFPVDALPRSVRTLVDEGAGSLRVAPDMFAVLALACCASAIGVTRALRLKPGWVEHASLWVVVVAPPGAAKTPVFRSVLGPLRKWQTGRLDEYREALTVWDAQLAAWEALPKSRRGPRPKQPTAQRLLVNDFTMEKLAELLHENPRGLAVVRDEASGFVRQMNMYRGGVGADRSNFLSMWSSEPITVDRKVNPAPVHIDRPVVSIMGGIQPELLSELGDLRGRDDGMIDRFLVSVPEIPTGEWVEATIDAETQRAWRNVISSLLELEPDVGATGRPRPRVIGFTELAKSVWVKEFNKHNADAQHPDLPPQLRGAYAKMESYAGRLALVLHVVRHVGGETDSDAVDVASVTAAWRVIDYFKSHLPAARGHLSQHRLDNDVSLLVAWLRRRGGRGTQREMVRNNVANVRTVPEARNLIDRFVARGLGTFQPAAGPGPQTWVIQLHRSG